MSCAYRHAATRIATMAGIPPDLMLTAMDIARQRRVIFPDLPPDRLRTLAQMLGISPTCGNPQQVIARIQCALIALGTLHPSQPWVERGMAIAAALGVPDDHLPVPVHPEIMATVRAQWAAPPPNPAPDRATAGIAALWQGNPIPAELIDEAIRAKDRTAIVTWMAYGVWDDRLEAMCRNLTDAEIGILVRVGVMPDALVEQVARRWWSEVIPWEVFPLTLWDRVDDPDIARAGRTRTAAAKLIRDPTLRDDHLIAIVADATDMPWLARDVLTERRDLRDDRLIAAVATSEWEAQCILIERHDLRTETRLIEAAGGPAWWAYDVLIRHPDRYTDDHLVTIAAQHPWSARNVLVARRDLSDDRLIAAVAAAADASCIRDVLIVRRDLHDDRLIAAVAEDPWCAHDVLIERHDLSDDRLIAAVAEDPWCAHDVLIERHDLRDDRLIAAIATVENATYAHDVLIARPDLRTDARLLTAITRNRALLDDVLTRVPDLRDHPLLAAVRHADGSSGCVMRV